MAIEQSVIFTVVPVDGRAQDDLVELSVVVSPRLRGGARLGEFGDWLHWTQALATSGLTLELQAGNRRSQHRIDTDVLEPHLWEALFSRDTPVRSHAFDTLDERAADGVMSFSMRDCLGMLEQTYRRASIDLALPDDGRRRRHDMGPRGVLGQLLDGYAVHWDDERARGRRAQCLQASRDERNALRDPAANTGPPNRSDTAARFATFHHMPTPPYAEEGTHKSNLELGPDVIDFHQALSAIGNHPSLQRALGLVFDLRVPREAIEATPTGPLFLSVTSHSFEFSTPVVASGTVRTAYLLVQSGAQTLFHTAPRSGLGRGLFGLAFLHPAQYGLAQVDVDGGMHKTILLAESLRDDVTGGPPALARHPEVFDAGATLPALRSGGLSLYADARAARWIESLQHSRGLNDSFEGGTQVDLFGEDLVRGMRLDVWDDRTEQWHSLHARTAQYRIGAAGVPFDPDAVPPREDGFALGTLDEGWMESAATRPAPGTDPADDRFYLHEALARWNGWSLSVKRPDLPLAADPTTSEPGLEPGAGGAASTFPIDVEHDVRPNTLPALRFGRRYRLRGRLVNLAGRSPALKGGVADGLSTLLSLPNLAQDGMMYRRFEPVASPQIIVENAKAIADEDLASAGESAVRTGSTLHRLLLRTDNRDEAGDDDATADASVSGRHLLPPRISVEIGERLGMFDDGDGRLRGDAATWSLIGERDKGELDSMTIRVAGQEMTFPLISGDAPTPLPYLPDPLARGVALRGLPGTPSASIARIDGDTPSGRIDFERLDDPNPRADSVLLIGFGGEADWQLARGLRVVLAEPSNRIRQGPHWDADTRTLTVHLARGERCIVPVSCYLAPDDLPRMGVWHWLQEEVAERQKSLASPPSSRPGEAVDEIAHILQRVVEGGHWMLSPPVLLELVHAIRQPLGRPAFIPLRSDPGVLRTVDPDAPPALQTALTTARLRPGVDIASEAGRRDPDELAALTAWRAPGSSDAFVLGGLKLHGASTGRVDLHARWSDRVDDAAEDGPSQRTHRAHVDRIDLPTLREAYLQASDAAAPDIDDPFPDRHEEQVKRWVGYYDPEHDQIAFVKRGDRSLPSGGARLVFDRDAAPRHAIGDTRHHRIRYRATSVSRDADCFPDTPTDTGAGYTRSGTEVEVRVPASARPLAPDVAYVLPAFGWQRQTQTGIKRSVRFGGGLRVYLRRPWFSSGDGEMLGVALWPASGSWPSADQRDAARSWFTQWGMDPMWRTSPLGGTPNPEDFPDRTAEARDVRLEETSMLRVDVAAFDTHYDPERRLWYADLTLDAGSTYGAFVRLALVRYQPDALPDVRISRVVLADFAQLSPSRAVLVQAHPAKSGVLRVQVSGIAPQRPPKGAAPTRFRVRVQERMPGFGPELGWGDVPAGVVQIAVGAEVSPVSPNGLALWEGDLTFAQPPQPAQYRLLIEEHELITTDSARASSPDAGPERLVFAETIALDASLTARA